MNSEPQKSSALRQDALDHASKLTATLFVTMLLALAMKVYMPRALGTEKMGEFFFAESFPVFFFAFMPLGLTSYIQKHIPANHTHAREIFSSILSFELVFAAVIFFVIGASLYFLGYNPYAIGLGMIMALYNAMLVLYQYILKPTFLALGHINLISRLEIMVKALLVTTVIAALTLNVDLYVIAVLFLASQLVGFLVLMRKSLSLTLVQTPPQAAVVKEMVVVSLPFFLSNIFSQIYISSDATLLSKLSNNTEVGLYGAAVRLMGVFLLLVPILQSAMMPLLSKAYKDEPVEYPRFARDILRSVIVLSLPMAWGLILFAREGVLILYGAEFLDSARIICHLAPVLTLTYMTVLLSMNATIASNGHSMALIFFLSLLVNIGLNLIFIPLGANFWGVGGAGAAVASTTLASEVFTFLGLLYTTSGKLFDRKLFTALLLVLLPLILAIFYFNEMMAWSLGVRIAGFIVGVPLYMYGTRLVTWKEVRYFHQIIVQRLRARAV